MEKQRLEQALIAADAAGDTEAATQLAQALRQYSAPANAGSPKATASDRAQAVSSGGYAGIANTLGLPVDTVMNVWDLAKAALGTTQGLVTGEAPSPMFDPSNRAEMVGSSEWIKAQMGKTGGLMPTAPARPDDRASRWLHNAANIGTGVYLGSAIPTPKVQPRVNPRGADFAAPNAQANASAGVNIGPSQAGAQATVQGGATAAGRGGGYNFGSVGPNGATGLTPGQQSAAAAGRDMGMRLTPGQATGNKLLQRLEAKLESQPMTAGPFDRIKDTNIRSVNRAAAHAIGESTDNLSADVLDNAVTRMGRVFEDARDDVQRVIDPQEFTNRMAAVSDEFEAIGPQVWQHPLVTRLVKHAESGTATGKDLGNLTSKLTREAHRHMTSANGDRELGQALYRVKDYVDDLVAQGLSGERLARYNQTRGEYRNLMLLTSRNGVINPSTGNVNGSALASLLQQKDRAGFLFGRNQSDMYNAARFSQAFRPIVGDSGTATRMPLPSPTDFVLSLPFNLATRAYTSSPSVQAAVRAQAAAQGLGNATRGVSAPAMTPGGLMGASATADDLRFGR